MKVNLLGRKLFGLIFVGMQIIEDIMRYEVIFSSLKLFEAAFESLAYALEGKESELVDTLLWLLNSKNWKLKEKSSSVLVKFCDKLSIAIADNNSKIYYIELLGYLLWRFKGIV